MPHFPRTPEALLGRNDSKNPSTTCKGLTASGRACRRALSSPKSSPIGRRRSNYNSALGGVVAVVEEDGEVQEADFYCWQHKDQAEQFVQAELVNPGGKNERHSRRSTELYPLKEKSSIDTMVQKLGIDIASEKETKKQPTKNPKPPKRTQTADFATAQSQRDQAPFAEKYNLGRTNTQLRPRRKKPGFWASLCCMTGGDDDYVEIVRHKKRVEQSQMFQTTASATIPSNNRSSPAAAPLRKPVSPTSTPTPTTQQRTASNTPTSNLLSLIPDYTSPKTASALLAELTKPISPYDEEGYIYIFWLTPQSKAAPSESTTRSLLEPPDSARLTRRISDVMTEYSFDGDDDNVQPLSSNATRATSNNRPAKKRTIMLKIGRANNITRRMNEWQRQCGYALNLVRWYPYVSSSPQPSPQHERQPRYPDISRPTNCRRQSSNDEVRKVPCVKRVERLIHLELAEQQVKRQCKACEKEHREWFEIEASQAGVQAVDEVVRRWVGWSEKQKDS